MGTWGLIYLAAVAAAILAPFVMRQKSQLKAACIMLVALAVTKAITYAQPPNEYVFDMACDMASTLALIYFLRDTTMVRIIVLLYACMTIFSYLPLAVGAISVGTSSMVTDVFAFLQLITIYWGTIYGRFFRNNDALASLASSDRSSSSPVLGKAEEPVTRFDNEGNFIYEGVR